MRELIQPLLKGARGTIYKGNSNISCHDQLTYQGATSNQAQGKI